MVMDLPLPGVGGSRPTGGQVGAMDLPHGVGGWSGGGGPVKRPPDEQRQHLTYKREGL